MELRLKSSTEQLSRWEGFRSLLGWRYQVRIWAWDDREQYWRPAPFVVESQHAYLLTAWRGRARSFEHAEALAQVLMDRLRALQQEEDDRKASIRWSEPRG